MKFGRVERKLRGGPEDVRGVGGTMVEAAEEGTNPPDGSLTRGEKSGTEKMWWSDMFRKRRKKRKGKKVRARKAILGQIKMC